MNEFDRLLLTLLFSLNLHIVFSQQNYFNERYNMCKNYDEEAWSAALGMVEIDSTYVIAGATVDTIDFWWRRIAFLKIDNVGNIIWKKDYGDTIADYYIGYPGSFTKMNDYQYLIAGSKNYWQPSNYDVGLLMKLDAEFETLWTKEYDLNLDKHKNTSTMFNQIDICFNHDFVFGGSMNGSYLLLWRTDSMGVTKWYKTFHYGSYTLCTGYSVIQTSDSGFALGGFMYTIGQPVTGDPVIVKTDSLGNQEWVRYLGGPFLDNKALLCRSTDGNIIVGTVYADAMIGEDNAYSRINIVKISNQNEIIWDRKYGISSPFNFLINIRELDDGSVIASGSVYTVGYPDRSAWVLKTNSNGDSIWLRKMKYLEGENSQNYLYDIISTSDNGFLACGYVFPVYPDTGNQDAWVIKLDSIGCEWAGCDSTVGIKEEPGGREAGKWGGLEIWPNPCREILNFKFSILNSGGDYSLVIYDIFGRKAPTPALPQTGEEDEVGWTVDVAALPPGIYLAVVREGQVIKVSTKFVVVK